MSLARHPTWIRVKQHFHHPTWKARLVNFSVSALISTGVYFFTSSMIWFYASIFATGALPYLLIAVVEFDVHKPTPVQFSLQAMLIAILTLQLPVMLFFTAEDGIGIGLGVSLLLIWLLVFGSYVKIRLAIAKEDSAERAAMEKRRKIATANVGESE